MANSEIFWPIGHFSRPKKNGNVFSVDEMEDIHSWKSGGLIYPMDVLNLKVRSLDVLIEINFKNCTK